MGVRGAFQVISGSALLLPFACPLDHVLDLEQYAPCCIMTFLESSWRNLC